MFWCTRSIVIRPALPRCKRRAGSDCLLVFSVSSEQHEDTNKGVKWTGEGASLRFGDITEQHESLECVLNLCSQGHTHLRGRPALVHFQPAFSRHVAAKWWSGCTRGQDSWASETERAAFPGQRCGRIFTPAQTSSTVKMRSSGLDGLLPSSLLTLNIINNVGLLVKSVYMQLTPRRFSIGVAITSQTDKSWGFISHIQLVNSPYKVFWKGGG